MYSRLFDFVVKTVNTAMYKDLGNFVTVGILDIYGFEIFDVNGFEQLCKLFFDDVYVISFFFNKSRFF